MRHHELRHCGFPHRHYRWTVRSRRRQAIQPISLRERSSEIPLLHSEIFIPLLIYLFGFSQHQAQGTSLAVLLPPIGLLAALRYYRAGHVDFAAAGLLALGFFFGASIGAIVATKIEGQILRKVFGGFLFLVSLHMMFGHHGR